MSWYQQASLYVEFNSGFLQRYCSLNVFGLTFPTMVHRGGHASHYSGRHSASGHNAHLSEAHAAGSKRFASGHKFDRRSGVTHNAFGNRHKWNRFAHHGGAGWGGWGGGWGGWGGWVGPVFWPFLLGDVFSCAFWPYAYCFPFWSYGTAFAYDYGPYAPGYRYGGMSNVY